MDKTNDNFISFINNTLNEIFKKKSLPIQHIDIALNFVGYSLKVENQNVQIYEKLKIELKFKDGQESDVKYYNEPYTYLKEKSDHEKNEFNNSLLFLLNELGEEFIEEFINKKFDSIDVAYRYMPKFADAIEKVKNSIKIEDYINLIKRIKNINKKDEYKQEESISVLEAIYKLCQDKIKVIFIDPKIIDTKETEFGSTKRKSRGKEPDFQILNGDSGEKFYVEVSILERSNKEKESDKKLKSTSNEIDLKNFCLKQDYERIKDKLITESEQLPDNEPNIIILNLKSYQYFLPLLTQDCFYKELYNEFKDKLELEIEIQGLASKIFCLIIDVKGIGGNFKEKEPIQEKQYFLVFKNTNGYMKSYLVLFNKYFNKKVSESTINEIRKIYSNEANEFF
jgi:hypothetical protein